MPLLRISTPDAGVITYDLENEVTTIGRNPENDLSIEDGSISSNHARISITPDGTLLEDLGSTNGTKVNGAKIDSIVLLDGESIVFGSVEVEYLGDAVAETTTPQKASESNATGPAEEAVSRPADLSRKPVDFASESPFPKRSRAADPLGMGAIAAGIVAILAMAGAIALVLSMQPPIS